MENGQEITNSIKEKGSSSLLVVDPNWLSFLTPKKNEKGRSDNFFEAFNDDNIVMGDFITTMKSNLKNAHQSHCHRERQGGEGDLHTLPLPRNP